MMQILNGKWRKDRFGFKSTKIHRKKHRNKHDIPECDKDDEDVSGVEFQSDTK